MLTSVVAKHTSLSKVASRDSLIRTFTGTALG